ncbi:ParB N-terminal domain-containing protein [Alisedimentitalea sp. MJ-SS2]|uniref:ParB/RepB/Spo0J family partition protein n=1 Tax=Aliisedimentitalea sp. MJ-SS2 TaxID=3049795 RepID=UPI00291580DC|nr:ParB N-terminal domain-containing protein [Alisedimentitalea sp. MJ-SS2]MDU8930032.1 ParB N-terminal domain-containing protein [Alisedimentitalea sp. MJ-SS2]
MAKRKRLTPANPVYDPDMSGGAGPLPASRAPIADIASDSSARAALNEVTDELTRAREEGRMVLSLPLEQIDQGYLVRDRVAVDADEMQALMASIRERGQQAPIEVLALQDGRYGLISGWRRCRALAALHDETGDPGFGQVLALLRNPAELSDSYLAMVEENELRANLSYFERARIAAKAVDQGVFETEKTALLALFKTASRAKRSKIRSFLPLVHRLDGALRFPQAIGERLGLALSKRMVEDAGFARRLSGALKRANPAQAEDELRLLNQSLKGGLETKLAAEPPAWTDTDIRPGLTLRRHQASGRIELHGKGVTADLHDRLAEWLRAHK